jgi:hypothetical protein
MFSVFFLWECRQANPFDQCKYGKPQAIFTEAHPDVKRQQFRIAKQESIEEIVFANGKRLTIRQSGCDTISQHFEFLLPEETWSDTPEFWIQRSIEEFDELATIDPSSLGFSTWARAIEAHAPAMSLTESFEVQPGFYVRIDRIVDTDHAILMVTLSENF